MSTPDISLPAQTRPGPVEEKKPMIIVPPGFKTKPALSLRPSIPNIDTDHAILSVLPAPDHIWHSGPRAGEVGACIAAGGTGKSFAMLEIGCAVATGGRLNPLGIEPTMHGDVLYFSFEDSPESLMERLQAIGQEIKSDKAALKMLRERFHLYPLVGHAQEDEWNIVKELVDNIIRWTKREHIDAEETDTTPRKTPVRLIVIDTFSRAHTLEENSNEDMSTVLAALERLARATGAAVIYLHHASKMAALNGMGHTQQAARGAGAMIDNARFALFLSTMTPEQAKEWGDIHGNPVPEDERRNYVLLGMSKFNNGRQGGDYWTKRDEKGVLTRCGDLCRISDIERADYQPWAPKKQKASYENRYEKIRG